MVVVIVVISALALTPCELSTVELLRILLLLINEIVFLEDISFDLFVSVD